MEIKFKKFNAYIVFFLISSLAFTTFIYYLFFINVSSNNKESQNRTIENSLLTEFVFSFDSVPYMTLKDRMDYYKIPGLSLSIIEKDEIVFTKTYGFSDKDNNKLLDDNTMFQSASTGKVLTTTLALILVNEGVLKLDEDVNLQLKTWKIPKSDFTKTKPITLRNLLSHTAGLSTHGFDGYSKTAELPNIYQILNGEHPSNSEKVQSVLAPGTKWEYSGGGYQVVQLLIEDVTGKSFTEIAQEKIIEPLKMENTFWKTRLPEIYSDNVSKEYYKGNTEIEGGWYNLASNGAGGGLWTTPSDLAKFIIALNRSKTATTPLNISKELSIEMQRKQAQNKDFGLGLFLELAKDYKAIYHPGGNRGFRTMLYYLPEQHQGIVIMANSDNALYIIPEIMRSASFMYKWPSYKPKTKEPPNSVVDIINSYKIQQDTIKLKKNILKIYKEKLYRESIYTELSNAGASEYHIWRMDESILFFRLVNEIYKDSIDTYINLGMAYRRNEEYFKAKKMFEIGLKLNPNDEFLKSKIDEMYSVLK